MDEDHPTRPTTVYGASKLAGEWYALAYRDTHGVPVTVVRPFNTYGYREHVLGTSGEVIPKMTLRALAGQAPVIFGDGEQTRDFTFVTDTAAGILAATECDALVGGIVNVAYGREVSINRIAELVCAAAGTGVAPVHRDARPADVRRHFADVTRARDLMGWSAEVAIEAGVERYVRWFADRHGHELDAMLAREQERNGESARA
jgi:UDP-glucose 4-epimerase